MGATWRLPGYEVHELLGFGATGEVWRAVDPAGVEVALKRLRTDDPGARDRLRREAALVSAASGDHVVRVRDVVATPGEAVLVMDYAAGGSLAGILAVRGRLAPPEVVTLVGPLAAALADVHERGIVHGDVTPANIVFSGDGRPLLTDFGVARLVAGFGEPDEVEATEPYAAPELRLGRPPGPAADVFALCRVALEALDASTAPPALVAALAAGVVDDPHERPDARTLSTEVLTSCAAAPVGLVRTSPVVSPAVTAPVARAAAPAPVDSGPRHARRRLRLPLSRRLSVVGVACLALLCAVVGGVAWGRRSEPSVGTLPRVRPPAAAATVSASPVSTDWRAVVQRLDDRRAAAFDAADPSMLERVYVPASGSLVRDRATLQRLVAQGLQARGLRARVVDAEVVRADEVHAVLRVTHALSSYAVVDGDRRVVRRVQAAPSTTFTMRLVRIAGDWRVASISV